jgi:hypothetical protein
MPESKLPPGPWRVHGEGPGYPITIRDADDEDVIDTDDEALYSRVCNAVEALPLLVEAVRGVAKDPTVPYGPWKELLQALALLDGETPPP